MRPAPYLISFAAMTACFGADELDHCDNPVDYEVVDTFASDRLLAGYSRSIAELAGAFETGLTGPLESRNGAVSIDARMYLHFAETGAVQTYRGDTCDPEVFVVDAVWEVQDADGVPLAASPGETGTEHRWGRTALDEYLGTRAIEVHDALWETLGQDPVETQDACVAFDCAVGDAFRCSIGLSYSCADRSGTWLVDGILEVP